MAYPVIADITSLTRVLLNDTQNAGAGLVFTDTAPFTLPLLNDACRRLQRELENGGVPSKTTEIFLFNLPQINTPNGSGLPDPAVYQYLGFTGFYDGQTLLATPTLPSDLVAPLRLYQRTTGTDLTFDEMNRAQAGLPSVNQDFSLGSWEWRSDAIYWNGSLVNKDIRLRYKQGFTAFTGSPNFTTTQVPFLDSEEALSYFMAYKFSSSTSGYGAAQDYFLGFKQALDKVINRYVRELQRTNYTRGAYGDSGDAFSWF